MLTEILILFALLLFNGFFAMSELAVFSSSKPLLRQEAKKGSRRAAIALDLAENSGRFLSTVQVGITVGATVAGAYGTAAFSERLAPVLNAYPFINPHGETLAAVIVVAIITFFSVVIGELLPKQLALNSAEKIAMAVAPTMARISWFCTPLVVVLEKSAGAIMFLLRIRERDDSVTEAEVKAVIAEGVASGAIEEQEQQVIQRVIRLGDRDVKSIMTHRSEVAYIDIDDSLDTVREKMIKAGHSSFPIVDKNNTRVLGVVRAKDLLTAATDRQTFRVGDYMKDILFVPDTTSCLNALHLFRTEHVNVAAVIDEYGTFEGLFTHADVLEAIVGIIRSNYDREGDPLIVQRDDGSWLVDGLTPIDEVGMTLNLEDLTATGDYQTIAGFVLNNLKVSPHAGVAFDHAGHRFEIVDMDRHRIDKILIARLQPQVPPEDGDAGE